MSKPGASENNNIVIFDTSNYKFKSTTNFDMYNHHITYHAIVCASVLFIYKYIFACESVHVHMVYTQVYMCKHSSTSAHVQVYICMCTCVTVHVQVHLCKCISRHGQVCMFMCTCASV